MYKLNVSSSQAFTIYNSKLHQRIQGAAIFDTPKKEVVIEKKTTPFETKIYRSTALAFFLVAVIGLLSLVLPVAAAEINYRISNLQGKKITLSDTEIDEPTPFGKFTNAYAFLEEQKNHKSAIETESFPKEFKIIIPKINLEANVIPNVNPNSEQEYQVQLQQGVAHANGSYLPGEEGTVFLFAHSTDSIENILKYNAKFFAVKDLEVGDQIIINYGKNKYTYEIENKLITNPENIDVVRKSGADLILSTCWPPGTNWQRLLVFARKV